MRGRVRKDLETVRGIGTGKCPGGMWVLASYGAEDLAEASAGLEGGVGTPRWMHGSSVEGQIETLFDDPGLAAVERTPRRT